MKKREIIIVVIVLLFGIIHHFFESGDISFSEAFSINPKRLFDEKNSNLYIKKEINLNNIKIIELKNLAGKIEVEKSPDNIAVIKPSIYIYHKNKKKADDIFEKINISTRVINKKAKIEINPKVKFPYRRIRIHFKLLIPENIELNLSNKYGNISVTNIDSNLRIKNSYGNTLLSDINGEVELLTFQAKYVEIKNVSSLKIKCHHSKLTITNVKNKIDIHNAFNCKIKVKDCGEFNMDGSHTKIHLINIKNNINIKDTHGFINMEEIKGDIKILAKDCNIKLDNIVSNYFILKNTYKNVEIKNISGEDLNISVAHGDLNLTFNNIKGRINIKNKHSDIKMKYPELVNPSLNINTTYGKIINKTSVEFNILKEKERLSLSTVEGTPEIIINNSYGNIILKNLN